MIRWRDIGERSDRALSSPWFFLAFNVVLALLLAISMNLGNLFISIVTADAVLLGAALSRAGWKAVHAKLDELLHAAEGARSDLAHIEDRDETEIGEARR